MKESKTYNGIPPEGINTPKGYLYYPPNQGIQILFMIGSFISAIFLGWFISNVAGIVSDFASGFICFVFLMIFFLGYGLWVSYVSALAFSIIKWPIIKILVKLLFKKEKPASINELFPEKEKLIHLMLRVQKYTRTFFILSWPIGFAGGFSTLFMNAVMNPSVLFMIMFASSVCYGYILYYFGRRGYLPLPEE